MKTLFLVLALCGLPTFVEGAVAVSTIGVAGATVTVTTGSAHGLSVNSGFCLSAPANVCAVAKTVPSGTTLTFDMPSNVTVAACAASCGTGDVAPKIIILDVPTSDQTSQVVHYLLWLTTLNPIPKTGGTSAWVAQNGSVGASTPQVNAIAAGAFIEKNISRAFPTTMTTAQIQVVLQNDYTTQQAALVAGTQPGAFYGFVWTGAAWVQQ
jgi:hypothetical protein